MRRASWMSFDMTVTRFAWTAHSCASWKSPTRYASAAFCSARTADAWKRGEFVYSCATSRASRWKGSLLSSSSPERWNLRMSRRATVPGRLRRLTAGLLPALVARRAAARARPAGALPPVDRRAVCFVRAIAAGGRGSDRSRWGRSGGHTTRRVGSEVRWAEPCAKARALVQARSRWARHGQAVTRTKVGGGTGGGRGGVGWREKLCARATQIRLGWPPSCSSHRPAVYAVDRLPAQRRPQSPGAGAEVHRSASWMHRGNPFQRGTEPAESCNPSVLGSP